MLKGFAFEIAARSGKTESVVGFGFGNPNNVHVLSDRLLFWITTAANNIGRTLRLKDE